MRCFEGQVAVVTGSAQGIGKAIVLALAKEGAVVCCLDIKDKENQQTALDAAQQGNSVCEAYHCDISDPQQINAIFDQIVNRFQKIDILINNAAVFSMMSFVKDTYQKALEDYTYNMDVNARGTFLCTKKVAPFMAQRESGNIINVNTNHIKRYLFSVSKSEHSYDASKYAQLALNESMAKELIQYGVRVNAICPASTRTPMLNGYFKPEDLPLTKETIRKATHYSSLLEPEKVAMAVCGMLQWPKDAPVGKEYLLMYSEDCKKLAAGPVEELAK